VADSALRAASATSTQSSQATQLAQTPETTLPHASEKLQETQVTGAAIAAFQPVAQRVDCAGNSGKIRNA
jgi:hypothetical protein